MELDQFLNQDDSKFFMEMIGNARSKNFKESKLKTKPKVPWKENK
jgi:hypothetical protein